MGTYATGDYTSFDTQGWVIPPAGGVIPAEQSGTWSAAYLAEQRLWQDRCNEKRYTRLFGYVGFADQETSPFKVTTAVSLEGFGLMDSRPQDRAGVGYFYNGLNSDFKDVFSGITPLGNVQGGEVYYNAEINPWFHVTFDLQAVEPAIQARDTALVLGMRAKIDF